MEIINGILLLLALALVWGAVNLERPAASKVEINPSDQMNEMINHLKRYRGQNESNDSVSKELNALKNTINKMIPEIPETMTKIEDSHERICQQSDRKIDSLDRLIDSISNTVDETNVRVQEATKKSFAEVSNLVDKIGELSNAITPLETKLQHNLSSLNDLNNDAQEVRRIVGL